MHEKMKSIISEIRSNDQIYGFDESTTKQVVILRLLDAVGWEIFNEKEVTPEYSMAGKRVDYALRLQDANKVFVEVKKISEDLENHQEQLLNYAFQKGVKLAILTNGVAWWFYLPLKEGNWEQRKFYAIDIIQQNIDDIATNFIDFLSRESVKSGKAINTAENIYKGQVKKTEINKNMPNAWNKLISEPDELLVELLGETLEKLCGFRADNSYVEHFLKEYQEQFIISKTQPSYIKPKPIYSTPSDRKKTVPIQRSSTSRHFPPQGTVCRFVYKGDEFQARIENNQIVVTGVGAFSSFSAASVTISNTSRNGWRDWELQLPGMKHWILADTWRKKQSSD